MDDQVLDDGAGDVVDPAGWPHLVDRDLDHSRHDLAGACCG